jgi:hypothetical protein
MLLLRIEELFIEIHVHKLRQCVSIGTQPKKETKCRVKKVPRFAQLTLILRKNFVAGV